MPIIHNPNHTNTLNSVSTKNSSCNESNSENNSNNNNGDEYQEAMNDSDNNVQYNKNLNLMIEKTRRLMQDAPTVITEASFTFDNNFCSVDILKNDLDGVEIYEVKSSTEIKDINYEDIAFQYYVLSCLDLNVKKVCIVF